MAASESPYSPQLAWLTLDELADLLDELENAGPRGAVLLGHSLLENLMKRLLQSKMVELSNSQQERIFGGMGPLGSMGNRVRIAYAFGIIGEQARIELNHVRELQNVFAHTAGKIGFDDARAIKIVKALCPGDPDTDYRKLFIRALKAIVAHIAEQISPDATPLPSRAKSARKVAQQTVPCLRRQD